MPVFECRLKEDRAGMRKGTTIHVSTSFSNCDPNSIAEVLANQYGKRASEASFPGYWDIRKL